MTRQQLLGYMSGHSLVVQTSVSPANGPQAAVVGVAITDAFEIVFDTLATSRKVRNLRSNSRIAFVIGGLTHGDERTAQYEGLADEPTGDELTRIKESYFQVFPEGRERQTWPGLVYMRARPTWIRFSNFSQNPPVIVEFDQSELTARE
jgi:general stress protein 26